MKAKQLTLVLVAATFGVLTISSHAHAEGVHDDYTVTIQTPKTQAPRSAQNGYFDLVLQPNQTQELALNVTNNTDHEIVIDMGKGTAGTTDNGSVAYTTTDWPADRFVGLSHRLGDAIKLSQNKLTLAAKASALAKATVTMPNEPVTGTLAGGISFTEENQHHSTSGSDAKGMKLNNTFKYDFAVLVQNNLDVVTPNVQVKSVVAQTTASQTAFTVNVANSAPTFANTVLIKADVTGPNGKHYKRQQDMMQFAPNSQLTWQIWTEGERVPAGEYKADVQVYYGKNSQGKYADVNGAKYLYHTEKQQTFTVTRAKAKKLAQNDKLAQMKHAVPPLVKGVIAVAGIAIAAVLWLVFLKSSMVMVEWTDATGRVIKRQAVRASRLKNDKITLTDSQTLENPNSRLNVKDHTLYLDGRTHTIYIKDASVK